MDLDEYLWRNKIKRIDFAKKVKMFPHQISTMAHKRTTPLLYHAAKIVFATNGVVNFEDLLKPELLKKLQGFKNEMDK